MFTQTSKLVLGLTAVALLSACTSLRTLEKSNPQPGDFASSLAAEYLAYSDSEAKQYDWVDSDFFAKKGLSAQAGNDVQPEELSKWKIPAEKVEDLSSARARLVAALTPDVKAAVPQKAARAQLLYDCWVEQQEENWQAEDIAACNVEFMNAIQELEAVKPSFIVYFDFDKSNINAQARKVVREMVSYLKTLDNYTVSISGHTDLAGKDPYNDRLSAARVKMVKKALVKAGIAKDRIETSAFGKKRPAVATPDGTPEQRNRRVEVDIKH